MQFSFSIVRLVRLVDKLAGAGLRNMSSTVTNPPFAKDYDTPHYRLLEKSPDYELREYEETKWAVTDMQANQNSPFYKLFKYITGNNRAGLKIPMTVPVRMQHSPVSINMAFMVPHHVHDPPAPNAADVKIVRQPKQIVYVKSFSGWGNGFFGNKNYFEENLNSLKESLDRDGKRYNSEKFFTAQYDSPWTVINRHNEVWLPAA